MNRIIRAVLCGPMMLILFLSLGVLTGAAAASASDNMVPVYLYGGCIDDTPGANGPVCQTDNATLTVYYQSSVASGDKSNVAYALTHEYQPTDLSVTTAGSPSYSGGAETDIIYQESQYSTARPPGKTGSSGRPGVTMRPIRSIATSNMFGSISVAMSMLNLRAMKPVTR